MTGPRTALATTRSLPWRSGLVALGSYVALVLLVGTVPFGKGPWGAAAAWLALGVTVASTAVVLARWLHADAVEGRLRARPLASGFLRFVPGLALFASGLALGSTPGWNGPTVGMALVISASVYVLIASLVELAGHLWACSRGLGPVPLPPDPTLVRFRLLAFLSMYLMIGHQLLLSSSFGLGEPPVPPVLLVLATAGLALWSWAYAALALAVAFTAERWMPPGRPARFPADRLLKRALTTVERVGLGTLGTLHALAGTGLLGLVGAMV